MTRIIDIDGTPFKHDEWVRYSMAKTTAGVIAVYGLLFAVVGVALGDVIPDVFWRKFTYGIGIGIVVYLLLRKARDHWDRAKSVRRWAEVRAEATPIFATILAGTILKVLQKVVYKAGESQDCDCIEVAEVRDSEGSP